MTKSTALILMLVASFTLNLAQMYKIAKQESRAKEVNIAWEEDINHRETLEAAYNELYFAHEKLLKQKPQAGCWTKKTWFNVGGK